ncbi:UNVERIFIED_CONTAM: hypothetical protein Scaly_2433700 [Sesamum calycinum]|uniref:DUF4218 domain-containing protein n=1 Tax=Sesamum calycinum TaxID=2727403 RepID=A0AAW2M2G7_9LAMI
MKDNMNARRDLKIICNRLELELDERRPNVMPKAVYTLSKEQKRRVCKWIYGLKFPDGYASNLACCADMMELRMHGMKSHDCYVFMQNLIPIAFREILSQHVWSALTEVSLLFQIICSTTMDVHKLRELEKKCLILCNLEKIFLSVFFDSMEDLIVHMPYEARVGANAIQVDVPIERASGAMKKRWLSGRERHIIETYIWTNCEVVRTVHPKLNYKDKELLMCHYWSPRAEMTSVPCYFVNGYNFQTERHNTG